jgi:ATP-dependent Clp protease ATP-binding subunit ClpC
VSLQGGRLINDLLADPYSVFLLDEAEKCHPNVWKPFLNLFDEGWIIDQRGRKAYGDRAIFILTTNAGDRSISQLQKSDKSPAEIADHVRKTLSRIRHERSSQPVFPPQFLSRIRRIITFRPLSQEAMQGIVQILVERMKTRWQKSRAKSVLI